MKAKKLIEEEDAGIRLLNRAELEDLAERGKTSN